jgi:hypothetical protein
MFRFEYRKGFKDRIQTIRTRIKDGQAGVNMMTSIGEDMIRLNREARLGGVNRAGNPLVRWLVRRGPYQNATGPTLAPFGDDSRSIAWFGYELRQTGLADGQRFDLKAGWEDRGPHPRDKGKNRPGIKILRYHAKGIKTRVLGRIVRDLYGPTPEMRKAIKQRFREFAANLFRPS